MPYIMVLDPLTHLFYIPDQSIGQITAESIGKFLEDIKAEKVEVRHMSCLVGKPTLWFLNRSDTNQAVQAQKMTRSLKFRI